MTQEQKDLLLKDLCGRLPYKVYGNYLNSDGSLSDDELLRRVKIGYHDLICADGRDGMVLDGFLKPYLFPFSSMTIEQREEERSIKEESYYSFDANENIYTLQDFYNKNHIDYRGFIEKGLAIDCTNLNIY